METGKVKWFDNKKGFGFIVEDSGQDVFVHYTTIVGTGWKSLCEGDEVSFDAVPCAEGTKAENVRVVHAAERKKKDRARKIRTGSSI